MSGGLRFLFFVNGEGRGHLAQAAAVAELLAEAGHTVTGVWIGSGAEAEPDGRGAGASSRPTSAAFEGSFGVAPRRFPGLRLTTGADRARISRLSTLSYNAARIPRYWGAIRTLRRAVEHDRPDVVVNFWDAVGGSALAGRLPPGLRVIAIGSLHYLLGRTDVPPPRASAAELAGFHALNRIAAPRGALRIALSLRPLPDHTDARGAITRVLPPLLRRAVVDAEPARGAHLMVYLLHDGMAEEVARWHAARPEVPVHLFWDRSGAAERTELRPNLVCHRLSDTLFLDLLRGCRGLATTAGFQAVAEARWLGKPVMVMPTPGHVEQRFNAQETVTSGTGIAADRFDPDALLRHCAERGPDDGAFRAWVREGRARMLRLLEGG